MVIINVENLNKFYGENHVLKDINLEIHKGECFGIIGKNGAGKTTLLECIESIRKWQSGKIKIKGTEVKYNSKTIKRILGVQLQSCSLPNEMRVEEAIQLFSAEHACEYNHIDLKVFGLRDKLKKKYGDLSIGQKRRLHLLLAILHDPEIIILDEPTAGLDIEGKMKLYEVIKGFRDKGKTILITSHDMVEVEKLCDRVAFIIDGKINKILEIKRLKKINKQHVIAIETEKNTLSNIKKLNSGYLKLNKYKYQEFVCRDINLFINEVTTLLLLKNDNIVNIFVKKQSLEEELLELIGGD